MSLEAVQLGYSLKPKRRGEPVILADVSIAIKPGELLAIVGPNGVGKTTLLRLLLGLISPTTGEVRLSGRAISDWSASERAKSLAFAPQRSLVPLGYSVRQVLEFGAFAGTANATAMRDAVDALELQTLIDRPADTLSVGQWQRTVLARAMIQIASTAAPAYVLADEPTAALDPRHVLLAMQGLRTFIAAARDRRGAVVVLHDLNLAAEFADRVLVMGFASSGSSVASLGTPAEVLVPDVLGPLYGVKFASSPSVGTGSTLTPELVILGHPTEAGA